MEKERAEKKKKKENYDARKHGAGQQDDGVRNIKE